MATVDFNAPDIAARIEKLSQNELDNLSFGVILLDHQGTVMLYSGDRSAPVRLRRFAGRTEFFRGVALCRPR